VFYPAYDPKIFPWLGAWVRTLDSAGKASDSNEPALRERLFEVAADVPEVDAATLYALVEEIGGVPNAGPGRRGGRHLHERFDALRTLRLVHLLRDRCFPSIPLEEAVRNAAFIPIEPPADDLVQTRAALARIEAAEPIS
jgi:hypothetical protein